MTSTTAQARERALAAIARAGGRVIRQAAYASLAVRALEGEPDAQDVIYPARNRFTPGWSWRQMTTADRALVGAAGRVAQDGPRRSLAVLAGSSTDPWRTGR